MSNKNLILIGDNKKILNSDEISQYINKIKVIYIDPPYNTQFTKSYNDKISSELWLENIKISVKSAYKYLTDDGVIFISIDDNEYAYLKITCDEIFGRENFIGTFITQQSQRSNSKLINTVHEYILCFAKNKKMVKEFKIKRLEIAEQKNIILNLCKNVKNIYLTEGFEQANKFLKKEIKNICDELNITWIRNYSSIDENGNIYFGKDLSTPSKPRFVNIHGINLHLEPLKTRGWSSDEKFIKLYKENKLVYKNGRPYEKQLLEDAQDNAPSVLNFYSRQGTNDLNKLNLRGIFDTPKPVNLIKFLIRLIAQKNDYVMDFFAGSGTTGQAVYELNNELNLNLHYILIQLNEKINPKTEVYKNCIKYGITPEVSQILNLRLYTFLKNNNLNIDYELKEISSAE